MKLFTSIENILNDRLSELPDKELIDLYRLHMDYRYNENKLLQAKEITLLEEKSKILNVLIENNYIDGQDINSELLPEQKDK